MRWDEGLALPPAWQNPARCQMKVMMEAQNGNRNLWSPLRRIGSVMERPKPRGKKNQFIASLTAGLPLASLQLEPCPPFP
jgi:hypothetical protein